MNTKPQPLPKTSPEAEKRKAAALRENLLKRKSQLQAKAEKNDGKKD